jgi:hypothetical protein
MTTSGADATPAPPPARRCPTCGARPGQPCVTVTGVPMTLTHACRNRRDPHWHQHMPWGSRAGIASLLGLWP